MQADDATEAEQAAHALALLSEQAASAKAPGAAPPSSRKMKRARQDVSMEHIRRQLALLQQQTQLSTEQVGQQMAWLRQQAQGLLSQVESQEQTEQDTWELDALEHQLLQSIRVLKFLEEKLSVVRQAMRLPVPPQVPPPAAPFPCGMPFPPAAPFALGLSPALQPAPIGTEQQQQQQQQHLPLPGVGTKDPPLRASRTVPPRSAAASGRPGAFKSRLLSASSLSNGPAKAGPNIGAMAESSDNQDSSAGDNDGSNAQKTKRNRAAFPKPFFKAPILQEFSLNKEAKRSTERTAFDLFCAKAHAGIAVSNPGTNLSDVLEKLRELWSCATPEQKQCFEDLAAADKLHVQPQQAHWDATHAALAAERCTRPARPSPNLTVRQASLAQSNPKADENKAPPTEPLTAFQLFSAARHPEILRQNPKFLNTAQPALPLAKSSHVLEDQWNALSEEEKEHWHAEAQKQLLKVAGEAEAMDTEDEDKELMVTESEEDIELAGALSSQPDIRSARANLFNDVAPNVPFSKQQQQLLLPSSRQRFISPAMLQRTYCFPRDKAAKYLNVSVNLLKRICRDNHIERWPYRKLQSLDHLIRNAQDQASADPKGAKEIIEELQRIKLEIYANPDLELDDRVKKLRQVNYKNDYRQRCHSDKHEHPGRGSRRQPPPPDEIEGAMVAAFAHMQEQEQMQDDELQDEEDKGQEQEEEHEWAKELDEQRQQQQREPSEPQEEERLQAQEHSSREQQQQQQSAEQEQEQQQQQQQSTEQEQEQTQEEQERQKQQQQQEEQQELQQVQQQQQQHQHTPQQQQQQLKGETQISYSKPKPNSRCPRVSIEALAVLGTGAPIRVPQQQQLQEQTDQQEHHSATPQQWNAGQSGPRSHNNSSRGALSHSRTPSFDITSTVGRLHSSSAPLIDEIIPKAGAAGVPGHSFQSTLQNTFGGDFVSEDGCIDGQPYEPEMIIRLNTGGEERTLRRSMLARVFHLPIQSAADSLNMGQTWLKKICRDFAIERWPYRKLQSLDHLIRSCEEQAASDPVGANDIIGELRQIKKEIYANPDAKLDGKIKRLRQANYKLEYKQRHNELSPVVGNGAGSSSDMSRSQLQGGGFSLQRAMFQAHAQALKKPEPGSQADPLQEVMRTVKQGELTTMEQLQMPMQVHQQQQDQKQPRGGEDLSQGGQDLLKQLGLPGMDVSAGLLDPQQQQQQQQQQQPNQVLAPPAAGAQQQVAPADQEALLKSLLGGLGVASNAALPPFPPDLLQGLVPPVPAPAGSQQESMWPQLGLLKEMVQAALGMHQQQPGPGARAGLPPALQPVQALLAEVQPQQQQPQPRRYALGSGSIVEGRQGSVVPRKGLRSRRRAREYPLPFLVQGPKGKGIFPAAAAAFAAAGGRAASEEQKPRDQQQPEQQQPQHLLQEQQELKQQGQTAQVHCEQEQQQQHEQWLCQQRQRHGQLRQQQEQQQSRQQHQDSMADASALADAGITAPPSQSFVTHFPSSTTSASAPNNAPPVSVGIWTGHPPPLPPSCLPFMQSIPSYTSTGSGFPLSQPGLSSLQWHEADRQGLYNSRPHAQYMLQQQQQQQQQDEEEELLGLFTQDPHESEQQQQQQQGSKKDMVRAGTDAMGEFALPPGFAPSGCLTGGTPNGNEQEWDANKHARLDTDQFLL